MNQWILVIFGLVAMGLTGCKGKDTDEVTQRLCGGDYRYDGRSYECKIRQTITYREGRDVKAVNNRTCYYNKRDGRDDKARNGYCIERITKYNKRGNRKGSPEYVTRINNRENGMTCLERINSCDIKQASRTCHNGKALGKVKRDDMYGGVCGGGSGPSYDSYGCSDKGPLCGRGLGSFSIEALERQVGGEIEKVVIAEDVKELIANISPSQSGDVEVSGAYTVSERDAGKTSFNQVLQNSLSFTRDPRTDVLNIDFKDDFEKNYRLECIELDNSDTPCLIEQSLDIKLPGRLIDDELMS